MRKEYHSSNWYELNSDFMMNKFKSKKTGSTEIKKSLLHEVIFDLIYQLSHIVNVQ